MSETDAEKIERRFDRLSRTLDSRGSGQLELLRAARLLKRVYADLTVALGEYSRNRGWTHDAAIAARAVEAVGDTLRHVLIDYLSIELHQMRAQLRHALDQSTLALDVLTR